MTNWSLGNLARSGVTGGIIIFNLKYHMYVDRREEREFRTATGPLATLCTAPLMLPLTKIPKIPLALTLN